MEKTVCLSILRFTSCNFSSRPTDGLFPAPFTKFIPKGDQPHLCPVPNPGLISHGEDGRFHRQTLLVGHWMEVFRKMELAVDNSKVSVLPLFISEILISKVHKPKCLWYTAYPESYSLVTLLALMVALTVGSTHFVYLP